MAPLRDLPSRNAQPSKSALRAPRTANSADAQSLFTSSKKDKRRIKHAQLMSKVTKSTSTKPRRRRPSKKLVTTLDALADALPADDGNTPATAGTTPGEQLHLIQRKSMKSKPGAMKRREKLDKSERDRFAKNLAQMAVSQANQDGTQSSSNPEQRWKALRGFISQTLEQKPEMARVRET